jgi:hypothetical protein
LAHCEGAVTIEVLGECALLPPSSPDERSEIRVRRSREV